MHDFAPIHWDSEHSLPVTPWSMVMNTTVSSTNKCLDYERTKLTLLPKEDDISEENIVRMNSVDFCIVFKQTKADLQKLKNEYEEALISQTKIRTSLTQIEQLCTELGIPTHEDSVCMKEIRCHCAHEEEKLEIEQKKKKMEQQRKYYNVMVPLVKEIYDEMGAEDIEHASLCTCPICYNAKPTHAMVPCGHLVCATCKDKLPWDKTCSICRASYEKIIKLYF